MYYIINQTNHVIAADDGLLTLLHVESIDDLTKKIILGDIRFVSLDQNNMQIITEDDSLSYSSKISSLSSMLGNLQLVHLEQIEQTQESLEDELPAYSLTDNDTVFASLPQEDNEIHLTEETISDVPNIDDLVLIKDSTLILDETIETPKKDEISSLDNTFLSEEPFTLSEEAPIKINDNEVYDLTIPKTPKETIDKIIVEDTELFVQETYVPEEILDTTPIIINVDNISKSIGISKDDYHTFLDEYIDTAISLETDLQSTDSAERTSAITTLTQLADVLELPYVNGIISQLHSTPVEESKTIIESFYASLSRLTTESNDNVTTPTFGQDEPSAEQDDMKLEEVKTEVVSEVEGFGTVDLTGIKPIHFDFQLEEAANDLSLPVELIEEFVHDFIDQAHEETQKMLVAYEKGDLDAIQKIGHLLKGASSNLRINALSDTLYEIQFCEDSSRLEGLIKRYWGHFLSFEQQIDVLSK